MHNDTFPIRHIGENGRPASVFGPRGVSYFVPLPAKKNAETAAAKAMAVAAATKAGPSKAKAMAKGGKSTRLSTRSRTKSGF